jgi:hypothetical protein
MDTSVEHRLLMGYMDVEQILENKRQLRIRKAMSNYKLAVHNKQECARETFLDEVLEIEREFQEELSEYHKMFDYALYFEREKKENDK